MHFLEERHRVKTNIFSAPFVCTAMSTNLCSMKSWYTVQLINRKNHPARKGGNDMLEFKDYQKLQRVPFVIYADFEALNLKVWHCDPRPDTPSTTQTTKLEPCPVAYKVVSIDENFSKPVVLYRDKDASRKLIESLLQEQAEIEDILTDIASIE